MGLINNQPQATALSVSLRWVTALFLARLPAAVNTPMRAMSSAQVVLLQRHPTLAQPLETALWVFLPWDVLAVASQHAISIRILAAL
jgi:hypothetical protein